LSAHDLSPQGVWRCHACRWGYYSKQKAAHVGGHTPYFRISAQLNKPEVSASESLITVLPFFHPNTKWVLHWSSGFVLQWNFSTRLPMTVLYMWSCLCHLG
jgi:hypothetical protein